MTSPADSTPDSPRAVPVPKSVLDLCTGARTITVLTGAGMSAESGVPTFRDDDTGLWARFDPAQLATPDAFEDDRALVFGWYLWRIAQLHHVQPNPGHVALARWERLADVRIVTQNVDDLHERAGSTTITHLHGSIVAMRCFLCDTPYDGPLPDPDDGDERVQPPTCAECGGPVRPGVVWFGEMLPEGAFDAAIEAVQQADVVLSVGTSGVVRPASLLPGFARSNGIPVIEINPDETAHSYDVDVAWRTTAAVGLPALVDALTAQR